MISWKRNLGTVDKTTGEEDILLTGWEIENVTILQQDVLLREARPRVRACEKDADLRKKEENKKKKKKKKENLRKPRDC